MAQQTRSDVIEEVEAIVGTPVRLELLHQTPDRRSTYRASGSERTAIVKVYEEGGATKVALRIASLRDGPPEPRVPQVWASTDDVVVLSELPGRPLRAAILAGDETACFRAGGALAAWHLYWRGRVPAALPPHALRDELEALRRQAETAPWVVGQAVEFALRAVENDPEWDSVTVIHRDLNEEKLVVDGAVGLTDVDHVAAGPPELDVGNFCAHLEHLARSHDRSLDAAQRAFVDGYLTSGAPLELRLLLTCRSLRLLRLACVHGSPALAEAHPGSAWPPP
ncbi:MAG TPA: hypothetical protein VHH55_06030 [Gaiellaceae bacterium]|nr:hypothetical protein [Gaiellaceae bacterium]